MDSRTMIRVTTTGLFTVVLTLAACSDDGTGPATNKVSGPGTGHVWSQSFGDPGQQIARGLAIDASGDIVVIGEFQGTVDFGGGPLSSAGSYDVFVAKFDSSGSHLWSKRFGDANPQFGAALAVDGNGAIVLTGLFQGSIDFGGGALTSAGQDDIFVAKLDADGGHVWSRRFGDAAGQRGRAVAVDLVGNVIVGGEFNGTVDFGGVPLESDLGFDDVFVAKFSSNGAHVWSRGFGDSQRQNMGAIAVDTPGNLILTGDFAGTVDFGGGILTSAGLADVFVAKLNASGAHLWSRRFGDAGNESGNGVVTDGPNRVIVTGFFRGDVDFGGGTLSSAGVGDVFLVGLNANGSHQWSKRFGGPGDDDGEAVAVDGSGNIALTGWTAGAVDFGGGTLAGGGGLDAFLAKFGPDGTHLWSRAYGDASDQRGKGIAVDAQDGIDMTGYFQGSVDFGGGALTSAGSDDVFTAKLDP